MTLLNSNLAVIQTRWPQLFQQLNDTDLTPLQMTVEENTLVLNNIQLTSNVDRLAEALVQTSLIPDNSEQAFVYGPALGDAIVTLLSRKSLKKLHVILLNKGVFIHSLNIISHISWLEDERVSLHCVDGINDVYTPFLANPAELQLADDNCAQLRDRIALELNHNYIQKRHNKSNIVTQQIIQSNVDFVSKDSDIAILKQSLDIPEKIFIAAAGPTLEDHFNYLQQNKVFIIAVDAAVKPLLHNNIVPNIVVAIDPYSDTLFEDEFFVQLAQIPLVYFPSTANNLLERWRGKRFASYSQTEMFSQVAKQVTKTTLFNAGSVIHPAIDLAVYLGVKHIVLLGADFSFTKNKSHARADKTTQSSIPVNQATHWVFNAREEKIPTLANFKGYLRDLERFINKHQGIKFTNGSTLGAKIEGTNIWKK